MPSRSKRKTKDITCKKKKVLVATLGISILSFLWNELTTGVQLQQKETSHKMNSKMSALSALLVTLGFWVVVGAEQDGMCVENLAAGTCSPMENPPMIEGKSWIPDSVQQDKEVFGCCQQSDDSSSSSSSLKPSVIGSMPQFSTEETMQVLEKAKKAWNHGNGVWPQMTLEDRIQTILKFLDNLQSQRSAIIQILMWEIGKNYNDAASEFDRTVRTHFYSSHPEIISSY